MVFGIDDAHFGSVLDWNSRFTWVGRDKKAGAAPLIAKVNDFTLRDVLSPKEAAA
ncbi:hypothetical protein NXC14_CH00255 [Rhizobium sp. NXC14]|nr:hypothetical protein NXC14_CH00255 [Rhizobium sp. NXC14]